MTQEELKAKILEANKAYRLGRPVMSDQAFDDMCEDYEAMVGAEEYAALRDSLHEETGKVKHPFIMGSLDKLKAEEPVSVEKWIKQYVGNDLLSISAKIDGISCRLHYTAGTLELAATRGDGYAGVDITDKVRFIKGVPVAIKDILPFDVRGELVIKDEDFADISKQFANPRNACAGIMNKKDVDESLLKHVSFVAYEVMGGVLTKSEQFLALKKLGFNVAWNTEIGAGLANITDSLTNLAKQDFGYPTDGLVLSSTEYKAENKYRPDAQVAFKLNALRAESFLVNVEWSTPSKDGRIAPVGEITPVDIGGSTISRVTLNNLDWIAKMNIKIGSKLEIVKSGDVIPKVVNATNDGSEKDIQLPTCCPVCGRLLSKDGPHLRCINPDCKARKEEEVLAFIVNLGIKRIKMSTLQAWGIDSMWGISNFDPAGKGKMGAYFANELDSKLWTADEVTIFKALPFTDLAEATLDKIIRHFGWDAIKRYYGTKGDQQAIVNVVAELASKGLPPGIGNKTMDSFLGQLEPAMHDLEVFTNDPRFVIGPKWNSVPSPASAPAVAPAAVSTNNGNITTNTTGEKTMNNPTINPGENGSICFTGALNSMTRSKASELAEAAGFTVKTSVSAGLDYLVTNNPFSGSTKNRKAQQYGTRIITEEEFLMMVS